MPSLHHPQPQTIRLSGNWQVQPEPLDSDFAPGHAAPPWIDLPECAHLQPALYPHQPYWGERLRAINQRAWVYRRTFRLPAAKFRRARLRFEAVDYFADVWLNGQLVGRHEGGFAPFELDITEHLAEAEQTLTVRVSSPWDAPNPKGTYPTNHVIRGLVKGLYEHGEGVIPPDVNPLGIWRPVWLLLDQGVSIDHLRVRTELDGRVSLSLHVSNSTRDTWYGTLALDIEAENHAGNGARELHDLRLPPGTHELDYVLRLSDVHWWWPWDHGSPDLYRLDACLIDSGGQQVSSRSECFGVRSVRLERAAERFTYQINERPVFVRGSSYIPALYLSQCSRETLAHDLELARQANLNLLRVHVHVSPPELYDLCDRAGMLVWQDFELSWIHDTSPQFEARARALQRDMIALLGNHPSIITWACHNEPTMVVTRRHNLEQHPDPALYANAVKQDPTRPVFLCSGQMDSDWRRAGDSHSYYGAIWSRRYTDLYPHRARLNTEFGFEAPAALETLRAYPEVWSRLQQLEGQIDALWAYQAALVQYQTEHFRRLRAAGCAGYVHFCLTDLVPQVGCGVLDYCRVPKGGYDALRRASQPLLIALEHDGRRPIALWVFNDTPHSYGDALASWQIFDTAGTCIYTGETRCDLSANASQRIAPARWPVPPERWTRLVLRLQSASGEVLCENEYAHPFRPMLRPAGYPWKFDPFLGTKVFDRPGAPSLADQSPSPLVRRVPLRLREACAEWMLRQHWPPALVSRLARVVDVVMG